MTISRLLCDAAALMALAVMPQPSLDYEATQLEKAFDEMHATGITWVQDALVDEQTMQVYDDMFVATAPSSEPLDLVVGT